MSTRDQAGRAVSRVRLVMLGLLVIVSAGCMALTHFDVVVLAVDRWFTRISPKSWP